jgi:hypothetical protein
MREVYDLTLYELYWMAADPDSREDIPPNDLFNLVLETRASFAFFEAALEKLGLDSMIERSGILPDTMQITNKGIYYVEGQLDEPDSFLWAEDQSRAADQRSGIPASDRFVRLDHNSAAYAGAIDAGNELIQAVRESNTYSEQDSPDKEQRLAELEAGYRLLSAERVNPHYAKSILLGVLAYLVGKFADEPIGELARVAWHTAKALLHIR